MNKIGTRQIYYAYRKLKGESYYNNKDLALKLLIAGWESSINRKFNINAADFQKKFQDKVHDLELFLNQKGDDLSYLDNLEIKFYFEIKEFEKDKRSSSEKAYIANNRINNNLNITKCNYYISAPVEIHLICVLWLMHLKQYLKKDLYTHNYANIIRDDTNYQPFIPKENVQSPSLSIFEPYFYGYKKWRDTAISKASNLLDNNKNAIIISLDIQRFYYSVRINLNNLIKECVDNQTLSGGCLTDETFIRLTKLVHEINDRYTKCVSDIIQKEGLPAIESNQTILPAGLCSSSMISNLYLSSFDKAIDNISECCYYGRYVDDMLFVFSSQSEIDESFQKKDFIKKFFEDHEILVNKETFYHLNQFENLKIQTDKVIVEYLTPDGPKSVLKLLKKKMRKNSSEYRFLLDEDVIEEEFENSAYGLDLSGSANKFRDIKAFAEDKYGASKYLARKISFEGYINHEENGQKGEVDQILTFFKGRNGIEFSFLWEKVATLFFIRKDYAALRTFVVQIQDTIKLLNLSESVKNVYDIKKIREFLIFYLGMSASMSAALNPKLCEKIEGFNKRKWQPRINKLRRANLFRHIRVGQSNANYTELLKNQKFNLFDSFSGVKEIISWKPNVTFWLSPRFLTFGEISSMLFRIAVNSPEEDKCLIEIPNKAQTLYQKANFEWLSFFDGKKISPRSLFKMPTKISKDIQVSTIDVDFYKKTAFVDKSENNKSDLIIGLVNKQVFQKDYMDSLSNTPNLTKKRRDELFHIIDEAMSLNCSNGEGGKAELLVFPELSLPMDWLDFMIDQCRRKSFALVSGLEYIVSNHTAYNIVVTILPMSINKYYKDCIIIPRIKNHYAPEEKVELKAKNCNVPKIKPYYDLIHWNNTYFSVYNCFELSSIKDRSIFPGMVDFVVATEWNRDVNYFSNIIESWTRDLHCFVIQANTSEYGDSRIIQPSKSACANIVQIKGGINSVVIKEPLPIKELRDWQLKCVDYYENLQGRFDSDSSSPRYFKRIPPDMKREDIETRINNQSFIDPFESFFYLNYWKNEL